MSNVIKAPKLAARAGKKTIVVQRHVSDLPSSVDDRQREMEAVAAAKEEAAKLRRQAEQYYESVREQLARKKEDFRLSFISFLAGLSTRFLKLWYSEYLSPAPTIIRKSSRRITTSPIYCQRFKSSYIRME
ncbi:hypothetical protein T260_09905 [Geobacillus thermopakistaniensis]|uniref:Uncharacterized protein n=1 Tax=Geobacillus thermopakistaniensis (strain MAS1) TaxID=1408282 RepID=A0A7U9JAY3_GEOTM|nr:hypothetical protein T260_09905 [Geobacillus sp. MAS1]